MTRRARGSASGWWRWARTSVAAAPHDEASASEVVRDALASSVPRPTAAPRPVVARRADVRRPARGLVVAVWGPTGAPGRTTVAVNVAAELAAAGRRTLLVDADTYGGCVAQVVGMLDEAPGLAAAARAAGQGTLDLMTLARLTPTIAPDLRVLSGISRADRWPELPSSSLDAVWTVARGLAEWTVIDCGFCLEQDEVLSYDTRAPRRNAATLSALEAADVVLVVGAGDPVGIQRLVRGLGELTDLGLGSTRIVLVNRVRASVAGPQPGRGRRAGARAVRRGAGRAPGARRRAGAGHRAARGADAARGRARVAGPARARRGRGPAGLAAGRRAAVGGACGRRARLTARAAAARGTLAGCASTSRASLDQLDPAAGTARGPSRPRGDAGAAGDVPRRGRRGARVRGAAGGRGRLARAPGRAAGRAAAAARGLGRRRPTARSSRWLTATTCRALSTSRARCRSPT